MAIEFPCTSCSKLLRVGDESAGKVCKCPSCGSRQSIPDLDVVEIVEVTAEDDGSANLRIPCPNCLHELICDPSLIGTKGQCRSCKCIFVISTDPKLAVPVDPSSSFVFNCPKCNQLFEGKQEMQGKRGKCHVCNSVFAIELKEAEEPVIEIKVPTPKVSKPKPKAISSKPIRFSCSSCNGTMEVPGTTAGKKTSCPYCQTLVTIPEASALTTHTAPEPVRPTRPNANVAPTVNAPSSDNMWDSLPIPAPSYGQNTLNQSSAFPSNPYAVTSQASYSPAPRRSGRRESWMYVVPGVFILMMAVLGIVGAIVRSVQTIMAIASVWDHIDVSRIDSRGIGYIIGIILGIVVSTILCVFGVIGGLAMIQRNNLDRAKTAAVLSLIPCSCMVCGFPFGIWACVMVFSDQAKRDFAD